MRKVIISLGLIGAVAAAVPASAQGYGNYGNDGYGQRGGYEQQNAYGFARQGNRQLWQLSQQVDRAIQRGDLNRREAEYFRREIAQLRYLDQRYGRGGYDGAERRSLDQRIDRLRERLRYARQDDDRGYGRDGRQDRDGDGRYDRY